MAIEELKTVIEVIGKGEPHLEFIEKLNANFEELAGGGGGGPTTVTWDDIEDKPAIIAAGATQTEARTAIGAGTSNLTIGTTGTTALAGNTALLALGTTATTAAAGNHTHGAATTSAAGFMSSADKTKLDGVATGANVFTAANAVAAIKDKTQITALTPIADPATADLEAVATLLNAVVAALKA